MSLDPFRLSNRSHNAGGGERQRLATLLAASAFILTVATSVCAQEAVGTTTTSAPSYQIAPEIHPESSAPALSPLPESNLHDASVPQNEVSSEPRRFQYQFQVSTRGVYDDNINISNRARISDYYFTIEPTLTLGLGDIIGHADNYIRLDYAPSLFLFADHSEDDSVQQLIHVEGQHRFAR